MRKNSVLIVMVVLVTACSSAGVGDGGSHFDAASASDASGDATADARDVDSSSDADLVDSSADAAPDAEVVADLGHPDAGASDAGRADAGADAGLGDAGGVDAGPADAGTPSAPIGVAVDVTGGLCALDSTGAFWCWGRWATPGDVRYLGADYVDAAGTCARRSDGGVDCADFTAMAMVPMAPSGVSLSVDAVVEYSTHDFGCGIRARPDLAPHYYQAFCWTLAPGVLDPVVLHAGPTDLTQAVAVSATDPRTAEEVETGGITLYAGAYPDAFDINGVHRCVSQLRATTGAAMATLCGSAAFVRAAGDHHILGWSHDCAHGGAQTTCETGGTAPPPLALTGAFHDHAIAYTGVGTAGLYDGEAVYCVSDDALRCYTHDVATNAFVVAYTVAW